MPKEEVKYKRGQIPTGVLERCIRNVVSDMIKIPVRVYHHTKQRDYPVMGMKYPEALEFYRSQIIGLYRGLCGLRPRKAVGEYTNLVGTAWQAHRVGSGIENPVTDIGGRKNNRDYTATSDGDKGRRVVPARRRLGIRGKMEEESKGQSFTYGIA